MPVEMKIKGLMIDPVSDMPIIILKNDGGDSVLPIWVGIFEANAIAQELENVAPPRPMTHDLLKSVIQGLRAKLSHIVITDLRENTFYATIHLVPNGGAPLSLDARPSDAMALALRAEAPIFVEQSVLDKSASSDTGDSQETERLRRWLETVEPEELGKYEM